MKKYDFKKVIKYAGAIIAILIGSGFATGQEVMQYFVSLGWYAVPEIILVFLLLSFAIMEFIMTGHREQFENSNEIYGYYAGKYGGKFYDIFSVFFLFLSYTVMVAGAGATLNQFTGLSIWIGGLILAFLAVLSCVFGLSKIVDVIGNIGPVIVILSLFLGIYTLTSNLDGINKIAENIEKLQLLKASESWILSGLSYVGFNMLWLTVFVSEMGRKSERKEGLRTSAIAGAFAFSLGVFILFLGLSSVMGDVAGSQIPNLVLAGKISPVMKLIFTVVIFLGIYTTSVPLLWSVANRIFKEGTKKNKVAIIILGVIGAIIGLSINFAALVNVVYVVNGYIGIVLLLLMIIKAVRRNLNKKK